MKRPVILTVLIGLFFITVLPKDSRGEGKPVENISFTKTFLNVIQDTVPSAATQTAIKTKDTKKEKKIKVLPNPRRQPLPIPVDVKVAPVIKPIIKPVIKILH